MEKKTTMVTVNGSTNYATGGVPVRFNDLTYVTDVGVLQVCSNIVGVVKVQKKASTQSGQTPEGVHASGNIATLQLFNVVSGASGVNNVAELANATSLSGITAVLIAQGY